MLVRDCMTSDPITIRPGSDPIAALNVLKSCGFRHLPVLDNDGRLVGIVDRTDLESFLSQAGSPGVQKRQHRVEQLMIRQVVTVAADCPLEEAASLMVKHKIGSLPVVDGEKVVGIITETDIFRQFAMALGGGTDSLRLTVQVADVPGQIALLTGAIAGAKGNITSVVSHPAGRSGRLNLTLRVESIPREMLLKAITSLSGVEVLYVWSSDAALEDPSPGLSGDDALP